MPGGEIEERIRVRMRRLFQASGWTQGEFAAKVGREQSWASKYLRGDLDADIDTLARMAAAFGRELLPLIGPEPVTIPTWTPAQVEARQVADEWPSFDRELRQSLLKTLRIARDRLAAPAATSPGSAPPADPEVTRAIHRGKSRR